jgi:DNA-binding CsgD family transcriptional regulator
MHIALPNERAGVRDIFIRLQAGHCPIRYENAWETRGGKSHQIAWVNTILVDANGETTHIVATGIDITARVQAEMALSVSEARLCARERELRRAQADLTRREWEVLALLARDDLATYGQIGEQLHVSAGTIKTHVHRIGQALGLASKGRSAVVAEARARGWFATPNMSYCQTYDDFECSFGDLLPAVDRYSSSGDENISLP